MIQESNSLQSAIKEAFEKAPVAYANGFVNGLGIADIYVVLQVNWQSSNAEKGNVRGSSLREKKGMGARGSCRKGEEGAVGEALSSRLCEQRIDTLAPHVRHKKGDILIAEQEFRVIQPGWDQHSSFIRTLDALDHNQFAKKLAKKLGKKLILQLWERALSQNSVAVGTGAP